jgi:S1-C subfamily serine protease
MDTLDLVLLLACVAFGISGYRQGFLIGVMSFAGFLGGGAIGAHFAPALHHHVSVGLGSALFGLLVVLIFAGIGQLITASLAFAIRRRISWTPARTVDSLGGAVVSVASLLLVAWLIGTALANSAETGLSSQVRRSAVLGAVDHVVPASAQTWFSSFRRLLDSDGLPEVFGGIGADHVTPVAAPNPRLARSRGVLAARPSIVKVTGVAPSCSRRLEGSGFVISPDHILTNAHVVAGVDGPNVQTADGATHSAQVVYFDPKRDVAILDVPGLGEPPLGFGPAVSRGHGAVVAGYPEDGPFSALAARVRGVERARGPDIYQETEVTRQIYALYATVLPGNSGGPLLDSDGGVLGVVFASSTDNKHTGYALTAAEVAPDVRAGKSATSAVSTDGCD